LGIFATPAQEDDISGKKMQKTAQDFILRGLLYDLTSSG